MLLVTFGKNKCGDNVGWIAANLRKSFVSTSIKTNIRSSFRKFPSRPNMTSPIKVNVWPRRL